MNRRYGLTMVMRGKIFSASLVWTLGCTITSSPGSLHSRCINMRVTLNTIRRLLPIDWSSDLVLVARLERIDDAEDFGRVAASASGVGEDGADRLLWINHEHAADGECDSLLVHVCGILMVDPAHAALAFGVQGIQQPLKKCINNVHVVHERDLALLVANDWEAQFAPGDLVDILDPAAMALDCVCAQADEFNVSLCEFGLELGKGAEFSGAHLCQPRQWEEGARGHLGFANWCIVLRMAEEHDPRIADEFVEVDGTVRSLCIEVWSSVAQSKRSSALFGTHVARGRLKLIDLRLWVLRRWREGLIV